MKSHITAFVNERPFIIHNCFSELLKPFSTRFHKNLHRLQPPVTSTPKMPLKDKGKGISNKTENGAPDPTSNFNCPREIVYDILSRLPVKSLLRFKSVCKKWRNLISDPNFIATHFHHSSSLQHTDPSIIIQTRHYQSSHYAISLYNPRESVVELDNPFPCFIPEMRCVGPINGILCLSKPPFGELITLWNPAIRKSKMVMLSETQEQLDSWVSVGLVFDSQENDLLILRIFCVMPKFLEMDYVEICSTKRFGWKRLKSDLVFRVTGYTCNGTIKGVPYWFARMDNEVGPPSVVLVRFNVRKEDFEKIPLPKVYERLPIPGIRPEVKKYLVTLEDSLGMLAREERDECYVDVWVMKDEDGWRKKCKVGPLLGVDRILGGLMNGDIVVENENGVLMLIDSVTRSVKAELSIDNAMKGSYVIFEFSESLILIEGMLPVKKHDAQVRIDT